MAVPLGHGVMPGGVTGSVLADRSEGSGQVYRTNPVSLAHSHPPSQNIRHSSASCADHQKTTAGAGATVPSADICSMSTADIGISIRCCITQHQRLALARSRWTQDGDNMVPRWPEMLQHGSKKNSTWPKGASRSGQVGQLGAQVGPTWP